MIATIATILIGIQFIALLLFALTIWKKGNAEYAEEMEEVSAKEFPLKKYMPLGLYFSENFNIKEKLPFSVRAPILEYQNAKRLLVGELYGMKYTDYYFWLHNGAKRTVMFFTAVGACFFGLLSAVQGDISTGLFLDIGGCIFALALEFLYDSTLENKIKERQDAIKREFPEFVNKMVLLVNAGMTVPKIWEKIVKENKKDTPLQVELFQTYQDMQNGMGEVEAIDTFGRRCRIKEIMKFTTVISNSMKKGGSDLVATLVQQSRECWDMRCDQAKESGAKLGTKLLIPTFMVFIALILVVLAPAMMMMGEV